MFERFSDRAREVLGLANSEAQRLKHNYVGSEHILLGMLKEGTGIGVLALKESGLDLEKIRLKIEELVAEGDTRDVRGEQPLNYDPKRIIIGYAMEEARGLNHGYVGTEHLLMGCMRETEGVGFRALTALGTNLDEMRSRIYTLFAA